jgi:hypothetical protein
MRQRNPPQLSWFGTGSIATSCVLGTAFKDWCHVSGHWSEAKHSGLPRRQPSINIDVSNYVKLFQSEACSLTREQSGILYFLVVIGAQFQDFVFQIAFCFHIVFSQKSWGSTLGVCSGWLLCWKQGRPDTTPVLSSSHLRRCSLIDCTSHRAWRPRLWVAAWLAWAQLSSAE